MTREEFASRLQEIRHEVKNTCCIPPATSLSEKYRSAIENLEGKEAQKWLPRAQEAWKQLRTAKNRHTAVQLLRAAATDVFQEIWADRSLLQKATKRRRAQHTALRKARSKARKIGCQWMTALEVYLRATEAVDHWLGLPRFAALAARIPALREAADQVQDKQQEVRGYVTAAKALVEQLHQMTNYAPIVDHPGQKRGRQEKKRLNAAILGLEDMIRASRVTHRRAQILSHCLLYTAGLWPARHPQGYIFKSAQLRKHTPSQLPR